MKRTLLTRSSFLPKVVRKSLKIWLPRSGGHEHRPQWRKQSHWRVVDNRLSRSYGPFHGHHQACPGTPWICEKYNADICISRIPAHCGDVYCVFSFGFWSIMRSRGDFCAGLALSIVTPVLKIGFRMSRWSVCQLRQTSLELIQGPSAPTTAWFMHNFRLQFFPETPEASPEIIPFTSLIVLRCFFSLGY